MTIEPVPSILTAIAVVSLAVAGSMGLVPKQEPNYSAPSVTLVGSNPVTVLIVERGPGGMVTTTGELNDFLYQFPNMMVDYTPDGDRIFGNGFDSL